MLAWGWSRMCDTIDNELTADTLASEISMERESYNGAFVIVEGDTDSRLYKNFFDKYKCQIVVAEGKENALGAIQKLNNEGALGVLCIVDADYHYIEHDEELDSNNICITDFHDIEITLFESQSLEKLINEYGSNSKIKKRNLDLNSLRNWIYESSSYIGALRLYSLRNKLGLSFKQLKEGNYSFVCKKTLKIALDKFISIITNTSQFPQLDSSILKTQINDIIKQEHDKRQLCSGHDVCAVLSIALKKIIGTHNSNLFNKNDVEKFLRMSFEEQYFHQTNLYNSIQAWQNQHTNYIILKSN